MLYKWNYTICDLWRKEFFFHSAYSLWNITDRLETMSAMPSSRASSWPRDRTLDSYVSCIASGLVFTEWPGKPHYIICMYVCMCVCIYIYIHIYIYIYIYIYSLYSPGLLWWLSGKKSSCQWKRCRFNPWVGKVFWRRESQPTPVS